MICTCSLLHMSKMQRTWLKCIRIMGVEKSRCGVNADNEDPKREKVIGPSHGYSEKNLLPSLRPQTTPAFTCGTESVASYPPSHNPRRRDALEPAASSKTTFRLYTHAPHRLNPIQSTSDRITIRLQGFLTNSTQKLELND